jgi:hypothetical protein
VCVLGKALPLCYFNTLVNETIVIIVCAQLLINHNFK